MLDPGRSSLELAAGGAACSPGPGRDGELLQKLDEGLQSLRAEVVSLSRRADLSPQRSTEAELSSSGGVLHSLDTGLQSLREELAALDVLRSSEASLPPGSPARGIVAISPASAARASARSPPPPSLPPRGMPWISCLSAHMQGRLAACQSAQEASEVLEEALEDFPPDGSVDVDGIGCGSSRGSPTRITAPPDQARPELVLASVELLKAARQRAKGLEGQLEERRRCHEEEVAELRRKLRTERSRQVQRLVERLAAPMTPTSSEARGCKSDHNGAALHCEKDLAEVVQEASDGGLSPQRPKGSPKGSGARAASAPRAARRRLVRP